MHTNVCHQPGTSVVYVQQPQYRQGPWQKVLPVYLHNGIQIGSLRLSFTHIRLLGSAAIMLTLIGIFLIALGTTRQSMWSGEDPSSNPNTIFGSIVVVFGLLMAAAYIGICFYANRKFKELKETGVQHAPPQQQPFSPGEVMAVYPPAGISSGI